MEHTLWNQYQHRPVATNKNPGIYGTHSIEPVSAYARNKLMGILAPLEYTLNLKWYKQT